MKKLKPPCAAKKSKPAKLDWKPRSSNFDGDEVYCSPACGHECRRAEFDRATIAADKLCAKLHGAGLPGDWMPHVWENLGWHYVVRNASETVTVFDKGAFKYGVFAAVLDMDAASHGQWIAGGNTAANAVRALTRSINEVHSTCVSAINGRAPRKRA